MDRFNAALLTTVASAVALLFTANLVFFLPLILAGFCSGWFGMEQRYGDAGVN